MRGPYKFLPIKHCDVHHPLINKVFKLTMTLMSQFNVPSYDAAKRRGIVKGMMVRVGHQTDEIQVIILKTSKKNIQQFVYALKDHMPQIVSIYETISSDDKSQDYINESTTISYGKETIDATLNGFTYSLYPDAFFQLNSIVAESFYEYMIHAAKLKPSDTILDAYSGAATISHVASKYVKKGYAVDQNQDATHSARQSLDRHNIQNIKVITGDVYQVIKKMKMTMNVIFFDPPRTGLGKRMIELLSLKLPEKIVYASCNPSTLAKDLKLLTQHYNIVEIKPFDMFPQTAQIESVTILKKK
jgi:23S rRNA (uracil1939-C5)-methyltransferase